MSHARKNSNVVSNRNLSVLPLAIAYLALFVLVGCASKMTIGPSSRIKSSPRIKQELASDLNIKRLPISANILVDERTRNYSVSQRPSTMTGSLRTLHLPVGQQLMSGIKHGANLAFKDVYENDPTNGQTNLKIKLADFLLDYEFVPIGRMKYYMRMTMESKLEKKDGTVIYRKELSVENADLSSVEDIGWFGENMQQYTGDALATLVVLWVRKFVKDITQDISVQQFAQSLAGPVVVAEASPPEIIINSPSDSSFTERGEVILAGSISSESPIKDLRVSVNGRALPGTRSIIVTGKANTIALNERVALTVGENVITVLAFNESGGTSQKIICITRNEPSLKASAATNGGKVGERWAVVVGISIYKHSVKGIPNLPQAAIAARAFADFLKSPKGGDFKKNNVLLLTNEQATSATLRSALFTFLKKAIEEDLVIFFFSGQGAPEPGSSDNYYLLTHDADPEDLPSSAIPTWDVDTAFKRSIKARRAVLIVDACHVSEIGKGFGSRGMRGSNMINRYLQRLSETGEGRAIFTATQIGQTAVEKRLRGENTGLFTHYLLEALSGAADENRDGIVTLGEAIDYTTNMVSAASRGKQRPEIAGKFDRRLPLAVIK